MSIADPVRYVVITTNGCRSGATRLACAHAASSSKAHRIMSATSYKQLATHNYRVSCKTTLAATRTRGEGELQQEPTQCKATLPHLQLPSAAHRSPADSGRPGLPSTVNPHAARYRWRAWRGARQNFFHPSSPVLGNQTVWIFTGRQVRKL